MKSIGIRRNIRTDSVLFDSIGGPFQVVVVQLFTIQSSMIPGWSLEPSQTNRNTSIWIMILADLTFDSNPSIPGVTIYSFDGDIRIHIWLTNVLLHLHWMIQFVSVTTHWTHALSIMERTRFLITQSISPLLTPDWLSSSICRLSASQLDICW